MNEYYVQQFQFAVRIFISALCGGIIGYERQSKRKLAGIKTHAIVALSSALMMILSKYGFYDVLSDYVRLDPSRIAAGIVTAIGFLGSGIILFGNANFTGITTAAGIWATLGIGIAIGSGMYFIGIISTVFVVLIETIIREESIPFMRRFEEKNITLDFSEKDIPIDKITLIIRKHIESQGGNIIRTEIKRLDKDNINFTCCFNLQDKDDIEKLGDIIKTHKEIKRISM